jgi:alpha-glucoside transport system substrate-binding protein
VLSRRQFLASAAAGAAGSAVTLSGCRAADVLGTRPQVRVAVSWSATELQAFRAVLDNLGDRDYGIDLVPLGDNIETALGPEGSRYGRRPDIVMLPRPGLVGDHVKKQDLESLRLNLAGWPPPDIWKPLLRFPNEPDGQWYGLPFKVANKSAVWYRTDVFAQHGLHPPGTWSEWLKLNEQLIKAKVPPLALGAADGWVLTDFFENVLLGTAPGVYHRLERGEPGLWTMCQVRKAFRLLGRMWATSLPAGRLDRSLAQQFPDAVVEVFGHGHAAMVLSADYAESVIRQSDLRKNADVFGFPAVDGDGRDTVQQPAQPALLVGADVAVLAKDASAPARHLLAGLAGPNAPLPWITQYGGFLTVNPKTPYRYSDEVGMLAGQLRYRQGSWVAFDLSDQLGPLGGSDGLWRVLQNLLVRVVTHPDQVAAAADEACDSMAALERELSPPQGGG